MRVIIECKSGIKIVDLNRRKAIHERCLNCSAWIPSRVVNCKIICCPLFEFRTGKGKQNPKKRKEAIRKYCLSCMNGQYSEINKCFSQTCALFSYRLSQVDRSVEIDTDIENDHIETNSEGKTGQSISMYV